MRSNRFKKRALFLPAAALLLIAGIASSQHRGHGPGGFGGPGVLLRELDLSDAQREQVRSIFEEARSSGTMERMMEARKALQDAIESGTADEGTLRQLAYEIGQVEGDAAVERARIHARVQEILTPEQRTELEELKAEREDEMERRRERFRERKERRRNGSGPEL